MLGQWYRFELWTFSCWSYFLIDSFEFSCVWRASKKCFDRPPIFCILPPVQLCLHMIHMLLTLAIWYKCLQKVQTALDVVIQMFWQQSNAEVSKNATCSLQIDCVLQSCKMKVENSLRDLPLVFLPMLQFTALILWAEHRWSTVRVLYRPISGALDNVRCSLQICIYAFLVEWL